MHDAGYFMPIMTATFLVTGAAFILNRYAALAAILLAPVSLNILLFHTFLAGGELPIALLLFAINAFLLWNSRKAYAPLLASRV